MRTALPLSNGSGGGRWRVRGVRFFSGHLWTSCVPPPTGRRWYRARHGRRLVALAHAVPATLVFDARLRLEGRALVRRLEPIECLELGAERAPCGRRDVPEALWQPEHTLPALPFFGHASAQPRWLDAASFAAPPPPSPVIAGTTWQRPRLPVACTSCGTSAMLAGTQLRLR